MLTAKMSPCESSGTPPPLAGPHLTSCVLFSPQSLEADSAGDQEKPGELPTPCLIRENIQARFWSHLLSVPLGLHLRPL